VISQGQNREIVEFEELTDEDKKRQGWMTVKQQHYII
jgi:hypothetical protein